MTKRLILFIQMLLLINALVLGQRNLSSGEILHYWKSSHNKMNEDSNMIVNSTSQLNVSLHRFIDSLEAKGIDSLIIFSTDLPGYSSLSKCDTGIFPMTTFIIWDQNGINKIRKIRGACLSDIKCPQLHLFDFYKDNYSELKSDFSMPVIYSAKMIENNTISYSWSDIDHQPMYSFYYKIGKIGKALHFTENEITNKESLFLNYNLKLATYHWWQMVKKAISEID